MKGDPKTHDSSDWGDTNCPRDIWRSQSPWLRWPFPRPYRDFLFKNPDPSHDRRT